MKARKKEAKSFEAVLTRLSADNPKILENSLEGIDFTNIRAKDFPEAAEQVSSIAQVVVVGDRGMRQAID